MNSNLGMQILLDAISYRHAQRSAFRSAPKPVPAVQRPGHAPARYSGSDGDVDAASHDFARNPTARNAARMVAARRRAS